MKNRLSYVLIAVSIVGALALVACATAKSNIPEGKGVESGEVNVITASVVGIDKEDRTLTLRGQQGNVVTVEVPDEARNFDQIEMYDTVKATYYKAVAVYIGKHGTQPKAGAGAVAARAPKGEKPGAYAVGVVDVSATVQAINKTERTVTLKGADGHEETLSVGPSMKEFDNLRVGDMIHVRYTEAVVISVK